MGEHQFSNARDWSITGALEGNHLSLTFDRAEKSVKEKFLKGSYSGSTPPPELLLLASPSSRSDEVRASPSSSSRASADIGPPPTSRDTSAVAE